MLDNSHVYVTCTCILRVLRSLDRTKKAQVRRTGKEYGSLGDFPVGVSADDLLGAFGRHLLDVSNEL